MITSRIVRIASRFISVLAFGLHTAPLLSHHEVSVAYALPQSTTCDPNLGCGSPDLGCPSRCPLGFPCLCNDDCDSGFCIASTCSRSATSKFFGVINKLFNPSKGKSKTTTTMAKVKTAMTSTTKRAKATTGTPVKTTLVIPVRTTIPTASVSTSTPIAMSSKTAIEHSQSKDVTSTSFSSSSEQTVAPTPTPSSKLSPTPTPKPSPPSTSWSILSFESGNLSAFEPLNDHYGASNRAYVSDPAGRNETVMQVRYPAGSISPAYGQANDIVGGTGFYARPIDLSNATTVTMRYQVFFPSGFDFVKGGKLPGLYGGKEGCSGGSSATDCFSTRFMFRQQGMGELYTYVDMSKQSALLCLIPPKTICNPKFGVSIGRGAWTFIPGRWHTLEQTVTLNTPGQTNGAVVIRVDNVVVISFNKLSWRTSEFGITGIDFSTFFGGNDLSWATPTDQHTYYKDFEIRIDA